jgi:hypothetical protein
MNLTASIALAISAAFNVTPAQMAPLPAPMPAVQTVEEYVRDYFDTTHTPILAEIAKCESQFRQFDKNGDVLKNSSGSSAIGLMQIMSSIHDSTADDLDIDIRTIQGNLAYAQYLYDKYEDSYGDGTLPWKASKSCWSKSQAYKDMTSKVAAK